MEESATEAIETFCTSNEFELADAEWNRKVLISIFKKASNDIQKVDANFPLDKMDFLKSYLALKAREAEEANESEEEDSENESASSQGSAAS